MNLQEVPKKLTTLLNSNNQIVAIVLVGSYARQEKYVATEYSDMEIYLVVKNGQKETVEKTLPDIVDKMGKVIFSYHNQWAGFSTVYENLFRLELPIIQESDIPSVFNRPKAQPVKVLLDNTVGKLQKTLDKRPEKIEFEKLFYDMSVDFWYMLLNTAQYYKNGDIWSARHAHESVIITKVIRLMSYLTDPEILLLERNKRVSLLLPEKYLTKIQELSPAFIKEDVRQSILNTMKTYIELSKEVVERNNFKYPNDTEKTLSRKISELLVS